MVKSRGVFVLVAGLATFSAPAQPRAASVQIPLSSSGGAGVYAGVDDSQRNQPYTLAQQTTTVRTLADGTHITTVRRETRVRDAEGRVRTEITREGQNSPVFPLVQIFDPVARTWTSLDERDKVAHVSHLPAVTPSSPEQQALRAEGRARAQAARAAQPQSGSATPNESSPRMDRKVEVLAPRTIAGVSAEGKRITRTIPAGKEGNDRDLTVVTETWIAPDLRVVLERSTDDPRTGKILMTTSSLGRAAPDPALFQIPADFKVVDQQPVTQQ